MRFKIYREVGCSSLLNYLIHGSCGKNCVYGVYVWGTCLEGFLIKKIYIYVSMVSNFLWYFSVNIYIYISMVSNCLWYFGVKNIAWLFLISSGTNAFLTVMTKTEEIFKFCWSYEIKLGNLFRAFCSRARCKLLSKCDNDSEFWLLGGNDWYWCLCFREIILYLSCK